MKEQEIAIVSHKQRFRIGDKEIQFFSWGKETQRYVLVVHGWAGRATQFRKFIPVFNEADYRVIGFDGPAHGQSDGSSTTILEFEEVLKFTIQKWGPPVAIIAHSFGGGASLYSIANGLPVKVQINIASPVIADEVIRTSLAALNGSWSTGLLFKLKLKEIYERTFEEFTSETTSQKLPPGLRVLIVHDEEDREVTIVHPRRFLEVFPRAQSFFTTGLGHNRILKDDTVIRKCLEFVKESTNVTNQQ